MDTYEMAKHLPLRPPERVKEFADEMWQKGSLIFWTERLIYHRESVEIAPELQPIMDADDWERRERETKRHWGAVCHCTNCDEEYTVGITKGGILVTMGEDGFYDGWVDGSERDTITVMDGREVLCPYCQHSVTVTPERDLKNGITNQVMVCGIDTVELDGTRYAGVFTWLLRRRTEWHGLCPVEWYPAEAVLIDERGKLNMFSHLRSGFGGYQMPDERWRSCSRVREPLMTVYYDYNDVNHRMVDGVVCRDIPNLTGTTGEKTGLAEYIKKGEYPTTYLKLWRKTPYIENLVTAGFGWQIGEQIENDMKANMAWGDRSGKTSMPWANLKERKPHKMLRMTKAEMKTAAKKWNTEKLSAWNDYTGNLTATAFDEKIGLIGIRAVERLVKFENRSGREVLEKGAKYILSRRGSADHNAMLLVDYWDALEEVTDEVMFPRDLQTAHDRAAEAKAVRLSREKSEKLQKGFDKVRDKYKSLEWTDGKLCIVIPKSNEDLVREGKVLRHCVGGYGDKHCDETAVVFFVRHYRRQERSYYTMDYNLLKRDTHRTQLHGYGNEAHGDHKQYRHRIPPEVIAFADRWEKEILKPFLKKRRSA